MGAKAKSITPKIRAFIACAIPPNLEAYLSEIQACLKLGTLALRWVKPGNIHLTLKFLGDIKFGETDRILAAMERVAVERRPFTLQAQGLGVYPGFKNPRVLWAGLGGDTPGLNSLHTDLESELAGIGGAGCGPSKRPFRGHLTLARAKGRLSPRKVAEVLRRCGNFAPELFGVDRLILYKSDLKPGGAVYTSLGEVEFTLLNG
jgi:2'-5' RNA ligase